MAVPVQPSLIRGFRLGKLWRTTFALFYQNHLSININPLKKLAAPTEALAKVGGGDGNRTHVRNITSPRRYMLIPRFYVFDPSRKQLVKSDT